MRIEKTGVSAQKLDSRLRGNDKNLFPQQILNNDSAVQQIITRLAAAKPEEGAVKADGTWGSFAPLLAAYVAETLNRPILYISPHIDDADHVSDDLQTFSNLSVQSFPVWESPPSENQMADEIGSQRVRLAMEISQKAGSVSARLQRIYKIFKNFDFCFQLHVQMIDFPLNLKF